jgi:hypothetical protein
VRQLVSERRPVTRHPYEERRSFASLHEPRERPASQLSHVGARAKDEDGSGQMRRRITRRRTRGNQRFGEQREHVGLGSDQRIGEDTRIGVSTSASLYVEAKPTIRQINRAPSEASSVEYTRGDRAGRTC